MRTAAALAASVVLLSLPAVPAAQPALSYDPPAGWKRGPYSSPAVYTAPANDAEIHIYGFQRYDGRRGFSS
jgi:hypothetical protein